MDIPAYYQGCWRWVYDSFLAERFDRYQAWVFNPFGLARNSGGLEAYFDEAVRQAEPQKGERAVDVCCGTGTLAIRLEEKVGEEGEIWGVDLSGELLDVARGKDDSNRIKFIRANAQELPFEFGHFDIATVTTALHEMPHPDRLKILEELYRVMKPGGRLVIGEHRMHDSFIVRIPWWIFIGLIGLPELRTTRDMLRYGLEREIQEAGFELIREVPTNWGFMRVLLARKEQAV